VQTTREIYLWLGAFRFHREGVALVSARGLRRSSRARPGFPVEETFEVEGDVDEADLGSGPLYADGADEQVHPVLLGGRSDGHL
jgi:hypothetical protein